MTSFLETLSAPVIGTGYQPGARFRVAYEIRDALNQTTRVIPSWDVSSAQLDFDPDREVCGLLSFTLRNGLQLQPYEDFVCPVVTIVPDDGSPTIVEPQGLFRARRGTFSLPHVRGAGFMAVGQQTLEDLSGTVAGQKLGRILSVSAGANYVASGQTILDLAKLGNGQGLRFDFPANPKQLPAARDFRAEDSLRSAAGELFAAVGLYTPWPDRSGTFRTFAYRDPTRDTPDRVLRVGEGGDLIGEIVVDHNAVTPINQLTVVQEDTDPAKRFRVIIETDPSSPYAKGGPLGLQPDVKVVSQYADLASITEYAKRVFAAAGSFPVKLTVPTRLMPALGAHELFQLDLSLGSVAADASALASGIWRSSGFIHDYQRGRTTHRLARSEPASIVFQGV